jgi:hypothetical protein
MKRHITILLGIILHAVPTLSAAEPQASTARSSSELESGFRKPPHHAGIRCFWWWLNGNVTKEAITRDLEEMKAKGFSGALIFDADGSGQRKNALVPAGPAFGSPAWTKLFVHACKEAKRLDLELSLNIQSGWNLGGPEVTEEQATQALVYSRTTVEGPGPVEVLLPRPVKKRFFRDVVVLAVPLGAKKARPIESLDLKSSTKELGMSAPDCRPLLETTPATPGEAVLKPTDILDISGKMNADGALRWEAPQGKWEILRFGHIPASGHVSTHSAGWGGRVIDYLRPAALDEYWKRNVEPLCEAIGPMAGTTLRYIHTDSWEGGGMNWTPGFNETFRKRRGYDITPWLTVLAGHVVGSREDSNAFLADFRKTIGGLVADHYARLSELSAKHGMVTHPECSGPHAGPLDGLINYGRSELMMSEFWSPSAHRPNPESRFFVKQASSAAHTYGKRLVGAEGFTTIGPHWNDIPWAHMKPSFDTEVCAGLNLVFNHTFTCSPKEMGLPGQEYFAGTHFNPQVTWWDESPAFIDYMKRCQFLAQRGDFQADVLHYYGDHIPNVFGRKGQDPAGALPDFDYDVLSEELLLEKLVFADGKLRLPSGMSYRVLSLPDHRVLSLGVMKKIDSLVRAGATVLGPKPHKAVSLVGGAEGATLFKNLADGLWGTDAQDTPARGIRKVGTGRIAWGMSARELLREDSLAPDVAVTLKDGSTAPDIDWIHYKIGDADVYFLAELAGTPKAIDAAFRIGGRVPELWNAVDGSIREAATYSSENGITRLPLELGGYDSLFVVFRKPSTETARRTGPNSQQWQDAQNIEGPWMVTFDAKKAGPTKPVRFETLTDWIKHEDPAIKHYSGKAIYRTRFTLPGDLAGKPLALELGSVKDVGMARVRLNGTDLGIVWRPPFRVDLGKSLKPGPHDLEVMVVNSWRNRLIGDASLPEDQRSTKTNVNIVTNGPGRWPLESSGLLGPVKLVSHKQD